MPPRDNKFLEQASAQQFVQKSTDELKRSMSSIFNNTTRTFNQAKDTQTKNTEAVNKLTTTIGSLSNLLSKQNEILTKTQMQILKMQKDTANAISQQGISRFIKNDDPNEEMREDIDRLDKTATSIKDILKEQEKARKKGSLFGMFGKLLGIGGLLGFLFSGKKEFLIDAEKGLTWMIRGAFAPIMPILKSAGGLLMDSIKTALKPISGFFNEKFILPAKGFLKKAIFSPIKSWLISGTKGLGGIFKDVSKKIFGSLLNIGKGALSKIGVLDNVVKLMRPLKNIFGFGTKMAGIFGKFSASLGVKGATTALKFGGKAGKFALKKIPILGLLMGIGFGMQRFNSGDKFGGILEVASGIASVVPLAGTAISIAIDSYLLFRDIKGDDYKAKEQADVGSWVKKTVDNKWIRMIPGVAQLFSILEGVKLWKTDKAKAMKTLAWGLATTIPGSEKAIGVALNVFNYAKEKLGDGASYVSDMMSGGKEEGGDLIDGTLSSESNKSGFFGGIKDFFGIKRKNKHEYDKSQKEDTGILEKGKEMFRGLFSKKGKYAGIKLYENPNIDGLNPEMKRRFLGMAEDYFNLTGDTIQVNSAKRNGGGKSVHDYGWAIDINSSDSNALENLGFMKKWGFHRPLLNWWKTKEPWHVEPYPGSDVYGPRDTINNVYRRGELMRGGDELGKNYNLPLGSIDKKLEIDKPIHVILSSDDVNKLAMAFGEQLQRINNGRTQSFAPHMANGRNI